MLSLSGYDAAPGVDVLTVLIACFLLLVVERTLGDSIAERLGPAPTSLLFAIVAALGVAYVTTDTGQARAGRLFAAAEARGYRTAYFRSPTGKGEDDTKGEGNGEPARTAVRPATAIQPPRVMDELAAVFVSSGWRPLRRLPSRDRPFGCTQR